MNGLRLLTLWVTVAIVVAFGGCANPPAPVQQAVSLAEPYRLGVGDVISIRIFGGEEDMRFDRVRLNDTGKIILPFGDFSALGRTTQELEAAMNEVMKGKFLLKPRVWVNVEEYRPFFMQGQVMRPGAFPYQPGLNVLKALTIAGGFRDRAAKDKIFIVHEGQGMNTRVRVDLNAPIRPGDTVIVEESFF